MNFWTCIYKSLISHVSIYACKEYPSLEIKLSFFNCIEPILSTIFKLPPMI